MTNTRLSVWVIIAFAITGLLIGLVTGLSYTPVVRGLLPLLFAVIGGGAGFFSVKRIENSRAIGLALAALSMMALAGVLEGIVIRNGITWRELIGGRTEVVFPASVKGDAQRYARSLVLKLKLQRLNSSPREIREFMEAIAASKDEDLVKVEDTISSLERAVFPANILDISHGLAYQDEETTRRKEEEIGLPSSSAPPKGISSIRPSMPRVTDSKEIGDHEAGQ